MKTTTTTTTFGNFTAGPFIIDDKINGVPGVHPTLYIKLHKCYGDFLTGKDKFNAININGEPFFVEDDEKVILISFVDYELNS